ncbi:hypothetical protein H6F67_00660 [Microcoleus sp. FACHB-1515]|uniref:hypothetical protein n=1 Tax=Cyanophyceae TaxID=3028117 RepID=UPI001686B85B|nr:hypothetical protein [Microcoleus sp. FACHB-1515]MBD2088383.1 hypothetical protein [Microcoleus sp. FACHB-1515]
MITLVIVLNLLIALLCLLGAWSFLQLRRSLADITFTLTEAERNTHEVLYGAPENIRNGQLGLYELRQAYQRSGLQLQRMQRGLLLLGLSRSIWRPRLRSRKRLRR